MAEKVIEDAPDYTIYEATSPAGFTRRTAWKPGTQGDNQQQLRDRADQAISTLETAVGGWAGLSAAQKDNASKLAIRVVVALARITLGRLEGAGV